MDEDALFLKPDSDSFKVKHARKLMLMMMKVGRKESSPYKLGDEIL